MYFYSGTNFINDFFLLLYSILPDGLDENAPERLFIDCLQDTYLHQHVTQPTRFREGLRPTCDDLILTTDEGDISDISYSPGIGKSDHIRLQFYLYTNIRRHYATREYRLFDKADYNKMREMMLMINWTHELQGKSPQRSMDIFQQHLNVAVDRWVPVKKVKTSSYAGQKPVWMTQETLRMVCRKHSAWIHYLNTKDVNSYNRYIQARNTASHAIRNARRRFESSLAYECKSNNKAVWNHVNSQKKSGGKNLQLQKGDGSFTKDDASTAEVLNQKYYDTFTKENMEELPSINSKPQLISLLSFFKVTREQVLQVLKDLRIDKSPGVDGIHPHILKELSDSISYPLSLIFQDLIKSGIIPQQWKDAIIAPIF